MPHRNKSEREKPVFSASAVIEAVAEALSTIKREDGLTYEDLKAVLGKSDDQARKYCLGDQAMDIIAFARAKREWNGRFTGALDRLCAESRPTMGCDRVRGSKVIKAALALSIALEDGDIDNDEVKQNRGTLEDARDAIDELLRRPSLSVVNK